MRKQTQALSLELLLNDVTLLRKGLQDLKLQEGPQGDQGDTGEAGPKGDQGEAGERGFTGERGLKGDAGERGFTGESGPKGDRGQKAREVEKFLIKDGKLFVKFEGAPPKEVGKLPVVNGAGGGSPAQRAGVFIRIAGIHTGRGHRWSGWLDRKEISI